MMANPTPRRVPERPTLSAMDPPGATWPSCRETSPSAATAPYWPNPDASAMNAMARMAGSDHRRSWRRPATSLDSSGNSEGTSQVPSCGGRRRRPDVSLPHAEAARPLRRQKSARNRGTTRRRRRTVRGPPSRPIRRTNCGGAHMAAVRDATGATKTMRAAASARATWQAALADDPVATPSSTTITQRPERSRRSRPHRYSAARRLSSTRSLRSASSRSKVSSPVGARTSALATRMPPSPIAPMASSGWNGPPSFRTTSTSSGAPRAVATLEGDGHPTPREAQDRNLQTSEVADSNDLGQVTTGVHPIAKPQ